MMYLHLITIKVYNFRLVIVENKKLNRKLSDL